MTLNELYRGTNNWTIRHVIQDEIAMCGKDEQIGEFMSAKIIKLIELKPMSQWSASDFGLYNMLTGQPNECCCDIKSPCPVHGWENVWN